MKFVCYRANPNFSMHLTHKHFLFLMLSRREKKVKDEQCESSVTQSGEGNHDSGHNEMDKENVEMDTDESEQLLFDKTAVFKMIHGKNVRMQNQQQLFQECSG